MTAIESVEQRLKQLREVLAQAERWSPAWMQAWLAEAHLSGELARLKAGKTSCGCDLCRESYATIGVTGVTKVAKPMGRPPMPLPLDRLLALRQQGLGLKKMAELTGVSHMTIKRRLSARRKG